MSENKTPVGLGWITWDSIALRSLQNPSTDRCLWSLESSEEVPFAWEGVAGPRYYVGSDARRLGRAVTSKFRETELVFFYRGPGDDNFNVIMEIAGWDLSDSGVVKMRVSLNGTTLGIPLLNDQSKKHLAFPIGSLLQPGKNRLTLTWLGGSSWVTWRRLAVCNLTDVEKGSRDPFE